MGVQIAREQLLAGAGFTGDQNVAAGRRDLARHFQQALHFEVLRDDAHLALKAFHLLAQTAVFALEAGFLHRLGRYFSHLVQPERFSDVIKSAMLHGLHRRFQRGVAGDQHHFRIRAGLAAFAQYLHAVHFFHAQIGEHHVEGLLLQKGQGMRAALGRGDFIAFLLHDVFQIFEGDFFVVHDQQSSLASHDVLLKAAAGE